MNPYEQLGQLYCDHQGLLAEYRKLLDLVGRIKSGEVDPASVEVLPGDAWRINVAIDGTNLKVGE